MLDHVGLPVSDFARSKAFYAAVFAPLGYNLVMEVTPEMTGDRFECRWFRQRQARLLDRQQRSGLPHRSSAFKALPFKGVRADGSRAIGSHPTERRSAGAQAGRVGWGWVDLHL